MCHVLATCLACIGHIFSASQPSAMFTYELLHMGEFKSKFSATYEGRSYSTENTEAHFFCRARRVFSAHTLADLSIRGNITCMEVQEKLFVQNRLFPIRYKAFLKLPPSPGNQRIVPLICRHHHHSLYQPTLGDQWWERVCLAVAD